MSEGGSPHLASSGSTPSMDGKWLRLVDCPNCKCRLICIRSKQPETFNQLFFKCPYNVRVSSFDFIASLLCLNPPNFFSELGFGYCTGRPQHVDGSGLSVSTRLTCA